MIRLASAVAIVLVCNATPLFGQSAGAPVADLTVNASADIHKFPSVASPVIGKAPVGTILEIRRNLGSWVEVPWAKADAGIAFVHVNTGAIVPRSTEASSAAAQAAVAQIAAVAAAATSAAANSSARASGPMPTRYATSQQATYVSLPQHRIGMGASINSMNALKPTWGATARTWWSHRLGVQFNASRPQLKNPDGRLIAATQFAPSLLYSLPESVNNNVWLRPYVGAGPRFYRANLQTHLGYEAVGGAEATFSAMPQFALSADMGYRWSRPSFDGFEPRHIGFSMSGHWYVK
ncbi:MAG TPA: hypothetical protein VJM31_07980 [Vicinamibacterales bacterium]|nr:hypothetical protein [Vicinamibacterales bacterium]